MRENSRFERFSFEPDDPRADRCLRIRTDPFGSQYYFFRLAGDLSQPMLDHLSQPRILLACFGTKDRDELQYQVYKGHQMKWMFNRLLLVKPPQVMIHAQERFLGLRGRANVGRNFWIDHPFRGSDHPLAIASIDLVQTANGPHFPLEFYHPASIPPLLALDVMKEHAREGLARLGDM